MLLADAAQAVGGKLYIIGGGWSLTGPQPVPSAIAIKIEVPWNEANRVHDWELQLQDADGRAVLLPTPEGEQPLRITGTFEVGRPPGLKEGTPLDFALAINVGPLPLTADARYVWRLWINSGSDEHWFVAFTTRPSKPEPQG